MININWWHAKELASCSLLLAFVALKALKSALKGQQLASDTLIILLANAYHWNPCWNLWWMLHFWMITFYFHKKTTLWPQNLEFLGLTSASDMFLFITDWFLRSPRPLVVSSITIICLGMFDCWPIGQGMRGCVIAQFCQKESQELCDWLKIIRHTITNGGCQSQINSYWNW